MDILGRKDIKARVNTRNIPKLEIYITGEVVFYEDFGRSTRSYEVQHNLINDVTFITKGKSEQELYEKLETLLFYIEVEADTIKEDIF